MATLKAGLPAEAKAKAGNPPAFLLFNSFKFLI